MFVQLQIEYSLLASVCVRVARVLFYLAASKREYTQTGTVNRKGVLVNGN